MLLLLLIDACYIVQALVPSTFKENMGLFILPLHVQLRCHTQVVS